MGVVHGKSGGSAGQGGGGSGGFRGGGGLVTLGGVDECELLAIGLGAGGRKAAIAAAKLERQAVMGCGGTVDYLVDAVFNYPTLAESYKVAALDATNKMRQVERLAHLTAPASDPG